jgi:quercetin dioxygenase-like cupin family protein
MKAADVNSNKTMTFETNEIENKLHGEWLEAGPGEHFFIHVPGSETNNSYSVTEFLSSPGSSTPIHLHEKEDEYLLVLEGTVRILYGDKTFDASPGTMVSLLRGIQHAWGNPFNAPVRVMMTAVPGGCEEALREIASTNRDELDLEALAKKYAVKNIAPPLLGFAGLRS